MAERRMFAKTIIDSDAFLDMPLSTQALYFHLSMRADDEGFINNAKKIAKMIGGTEDELKLLIAKRFIIPFESGVVVIKHWKIHNYIRGDRIKATVYQEEKLTITTKDNGSYTTIDDNPIIQLNGKDARKLAYEKSSLPYSFEYKIRQAFNGKICPICGCKMAPGDFGHRLNIPSIQHNIPISKGGEHELHNISVVCKSCNVSIQDTETGELNNLEVIETWNLICQSNVSQMSAQDRIGKDSIGKVRLEREDIPTLDQLKEFHTEKKMTFDLMKFYDYFTTGNWVDSKGNKVTNWRQKMVSWQNKENPTKKRYTVEKESKYTEDQLEDMLLKNGGRTNENRYT